MTMAEDLYCYEEKQAPSLFPYVYLWASIRVNRLFLLKIEINDEFFGIVL